MRKRKAQRGIVIGPILFLIAIIGVLAAAIAAGTGGFGGSSSTASAKVLASAILDYANTVQIGVDRVLANGCDETQISFENNFDGGYENPNAPADKSCHVFDVNGGGVVWKTPPNAVMFNGYGRWYFAITNSGRSIPGLGTKESDLFLVLHGWHTHFDPVQRKAGENLVRICKEINRELGISSPNDLPYVRWYAFEAHFTGVFPTSSFDNLPSDKIFGKTSFCAIELTGDVILFAKALLVR